MAGRLFDSSYPLRRGPVWLRVYVLGGLAVLVAGGYLLTTGIGGEEALEPLRRPAFYLLLVLIVWVDLYPRMRGLPLPPGMGPLPWSTTAACAAVLALGPQAWWVFPVSGATGGLAMYPRRGWQVASAIATTGGRGLLAAVVVAGFGDRLTADRPAQQPWWLLIAAVVLAAVLIPIHLLQRWLLHRSARMVSGRPVHSSWRRGTMIVFAPIPAVLAMSAPVQLVLLAPLTSIVQHLSATLVTRTVQARTDPLTGLANRSGLLDLLSARLSGLATTPGQVAVMIIDLDDFKSVNDLGGHRLGDQVLVEVGRRLVDHMRRDDLVARIGGDEFAVLLAAGYDAEDAKAAADRVRQLFDGRWTSVGPQVGASVGLSLTSDPQCDPADLLDLADQHMYRSKAVRQAGPRTVPEQRVLPAVGIPSVEQPLPAATPEN